MAGMVYLKGEAIQAQLQLHAPYQCKEMCGPRGLGYKARSGIRIRCPPKVSDLARYIIVSSG